MRSTVIRFGVVDEIKMRFRLYTSEVALNTIPVDSFLVAKLAEMFVPQVSTIIAEYTSEPSPFVAAAEVHAENCPPQMEQAFEILSRSMVQSLNAWLGPDVHHSFRFGSAPPVPVAPTLADPLPSSSVDSTETHHTQKLLLSCFSFPDMPLSGLLYPFFLVFKVLEVLRTVAGDSPLVASPI
jgi:hypothetical protein